jgi:hypothetical protein
MLYNNILICSKQAAFSPLNQGYCAMNFLKKIFYFGEEVDEYPVRVINEREARAAAGLMFLLGFFSFLKGYLTADYVPERMMIIAFVFELGIRVLVNPRYAPFMIMGRLMVRNQKVDYVGAPQKRVAWSLGLALGVFMYWLVFKEANMGWMNFAGCVTCVTLLYFETAFGICLGCYLYNVFNKEKAQLCPGGMCEIKKVEEIQKFNFVQVLIVLAFIGMMYAIPTYNLLNLQDPNIVTFENFDTFDWKD